MSNIIFFVIKNVLKYYIRNSENYSVLISRLEFYKKFFVFDIIWKWNFFKLEVREVMFFNIFKKNIIESIF